MFDLIHSRLSFGARLALISGLFCAPLVLLLVLFVQASLDQINFSARELQGSQYLQKVWPAMVKGEALEDAGDSFGETKAFGTFQQASGIEKIRAGVGLVTAVADGSNLTLDPDLDSFYAMDAVTVRLPALYRANAELKAALGSGDPQLVVRALDHLSIAQDQSLSSLNATMEKNREGATRKALTEPTAQLQAAGAAVQTAAQAGVPEATAQAAAALDGVVDQTWVAAEKELSRLLEARIAKLRLRMAVNLTLVGVALAFATLLAVSISRALASRVNALVRVMERLSANDVEVEIPCRSDRNETGRIAAALGIFREGIADRNRLQAEANVASQANTEKLQATEAAFRAAGLAQAQVVDQLAKALDAIADGRLATRLQDGFTAEYEKLRSDFNRAVGQLCEAMQLVGAVAHDIRSGARDISRATDELAARTERQAASLEETAAAVEQLTSTVLRTSEDAKEAHTAVSAANADAGRSDDLVRQAMTAMSEIQGSAQQISQIIGVIDEIAFQTSLLALNAGVEAARAGEAGRGFAVVASEVRGLAQRSADAAKEIKSLISASTDQVAHGVELVGQTGEALSRISAQVAGVNTLIAQIAASAQEQASGLQQVNTAVSQMDRVTQENAAMVEQSAASSHSLTQKAEELFQRLDKFDVGGAHAAPTARAA
ncbi:methyl-accepting chemotaxis protein [Phenylobacterium sp.]|uniref:methyl-accepting chemotaxis protein n=1 Tax=Phenylobacterium sp. TaxID=1871053 RepID=UPI002E37685E|nr:methyl-accepting chemotaxis protein [Phenylobacterium sp.]HEX2561274.1 methyl-accepting chemotaxis protein [Phenylobacterium sp.]